MPSMHLHDLKQQYNQDSGELHEYKNIKEGKGNKQRESHDKIHID